ncbi:MAG: hypothetical protein EOP48_00445 [Sphingobacteriales bacterium]|nr:MAG: hypothetical protein EOP48_00445 [Sphingobacteriales bacterium]
MSASSTRFLTQMFFLICLITACGQDEQSDSKSVEIVMTSVKDQGPDGLCWAYMATGFVEQNYAVRTGEILDLSEEALAYYKFADEISKKLIEIKSGRLDPKTINKDNLFASGNTLSDAFALVSKYGVVPENEWSNKFNTSKKLQVFREKTFSSFQKHLNGQAFVTDTDGVAKSILVGEGKFITSPPKRLANGLSPIDFVKRLSFKAADFEISIFRKPDDYNSFVKISKFVLKKEFPLPLGFPIDWGFISDGIFGSGPVDGQTQGFSATSYHAVLITDWVNVGDKPGPLPESILEQSYLKPADELDYFTIKNSWGVKYKDSELKAGFYRMKGGYYQEALNSGSSIQIITPKGMKKEAMLEN